MNALEIANELDKSRQEPFTPEYLVGKAATILRQQQAEIEALKNKIKSYENLGNMMLDELLEKAQKNEAK